MTENEIAKEIVDAAYKIHKISGTDYHGLRNFKISIIKFNRQIIA